MSQLQVVQCPRCMNRLFHDGSAAGRVVACPHCHADLAIPADERWHSDPPRALHDGSIALDGEIAGQAPVQAEGRVRGHPFYFRAKWEHWTFTACVSADIDASCINPPTDEDGLFRDGEYRGFYLSGAYPGASFMRYDDAEAIIKRCSRRLLEALDAEPGPAADGGRT